MRAKMKREFSNKILSVSRMSHVVALVDLKAMSLMPSEKTLDEGEWSESYLVGNSLISHVLKPWEQEFLVDFLPNAGDIVSFHSFQGGYTLYADRLVNLMHQYVMARGVEITLADVVHYWEVDLAVDRIRHDETVFIGRARFAGEVTNGEPPGGDED